MSLEALTLERPNLLCQNILVVDGIGSSGKGMLSHLLASIDIVEKQSNHTVFDYISYFHWLGKITDDAAIVHFQVEADMQMYHLRMSRDTNFRPKDSTGVLRNPRPLRYFRRLFLKEGDSIVKDIRLNPTWLNEAPHDAARNLSLFFMAFGEKMHFCYIARDPEDLISDWVRRGFGRRIGVDPREFQLTVNAGNGPVPFFAIGYESTFHSLTEVERVALFVAFCAEENLKGLVNARPYLTKGNFSHTTFEALVSNPSTFVHLVAPKLGGKVVKRALKKQTKMELVPRPYAPTRLDSKSEFVLECLTRANRAHNCIIELAEGIS
jgi:hypothetical protein